MTHLGAMRGLGLLIVGVLILGLTQAVRAEGQRLDWRRSHRRVEADSYGECIRACSAAKKGECTSANFNQKTKQCTLNKITPGPKLVGFWPLNSWHLNRDISGNENHARLSDVHLGKGPFNHPRGAMTFSGRSSSYVEILNNGALDVRYSMTVVMYVYIPTTNNNGPLFEWTYPGSSSYYGVHIWRYANGNLFTRFNKRGAIFSNYLQRQVLKIGWNYIAVSYDYDSGISRIFGNGKELANATIGRHELETQHRIWIGRRDKYDGRNLYGHIACVQLYDGELTVDEVFNEAKRKCIFQDESLRGFWPMGNRYGNRDISGNENHMTVSNVGTTTGPTGVKNGAYSFTGKSNSYVQIPNNGAVDVRYSFTLAVYVKVASSSVEGPLFEWSHNSWGAHIWVLKNFIFYQHLNKRGGASTTTNSVKAFSTSWKFVAVSYNYTSGVLTCYADGKQISSKNIGKFELETSRHVRIGVRDKSDTRYLSASVACVQLYNKTLTLDEIKAAKTKCHEGGIKSVPAASCPDNGYLVTGDIQSIPDRRLRWSSMHSCARKPSLARINATSAGGYCGSFTATVNNQNQFLMFDFGTTRLLRDIHTRSRYGVSQWLKQFRLLYSQDGKRWSWIYSTNGHLTVFTANSDSSKLKTNTLTLPVYARFLRIYAYSWHSHVSFRADVGGCYATQDLSM